MKIRISTLTFIAAFQLLTSLAFAADLYRIDSSPYSHISRNGENHKSYVDKKTGDLLPANIEGKISITDHIARSRNRSLKDNSQFTSFSTLDTLGGYYRGGYKITVDLNRLNEAIKAGVLPRTRVHSTENIVKDIQVEMSQFIKSSPENQGERTLLWKGIEQHLQEYYSMVRVQKRPTSECDKFFWDGVNALRDKYPGLFQHLSREEFRSYSYLFNALRHVRTDHEVLIEGRVPKKFLKLKSLDEGEDTVRLIQQTNLITKTMSPQLCNQSK